VVAPTTLTTLASVVGGLHPSGRSRLVAERALAFGGPVLWGLVGVVHVHEYYSIVYVRGLQLFRKDLSVPYVTLAYQDKG
jgi:hypothetical protein